MLEGCIYACGAVDGSVFDGLILYIMDVGDDQPSYWRTIKLLPLKACDEF